MRSRTAVMLVALSVVATPLLAHDMYLKLDSYFAQPGDEIVVPLLNGTFSSSENAITADRVLALRSAGPQGLEDLDLSTWDSSDLTTTFRVTFHDPGTYAIGVSTATRLIELEGPSFNDYLEHDGIPDVLEARRAAGELDVAVVERYAKHVKAIIQVGDGGGDGWSEPMGFPAEVVPLDNPYAPGRSDAHRFRVLVGGSPVADQLVLAGGEGSDGVFEERSARSDGEGLVTFSLGAPGRWYVKFINMVRSVDDGIDYESKWATLTFELR